MKNRTLVTLVGMLTAILVLLAACGTETDSVSAGAGGTADGDATGETTVPDDEDGSATVTSPSADNDSDDTTDDTTDGTSNDDLGSDGGDDVDEEDPGEILGAGPYPIGTLTITVTHPDAEDVVYLISCLGDTATLDPPVDGLDEQSACEALNTEEVTTLLLMGQPEDQPCTEQYGGPDEATIVGTLHDQPVDVVIDRANGCGIYNWDTVLARILPAPMGLAG